MTADEWFATMLLTGTPRTRHALGERVMTRKEKLALGVLLGWPGFELHEITAACLLVESVLPFEYAKMWNGGTFGGPHKWDDDAECIVFVELYLQWQRGDPPRVEHRLWRTR